MSDTALLSQGGDCLAEMLGTILILVEDDELTEFRADAARRAILEWHQLRAACAPR